MSETDNAQWDDMVLVGTVARPHGLRGHVVVNAHTDFADERFVVGATFWTRLAAGAVVETSVLTVTTVRFQGGRPVVGFSGVESVDAAEALAGLELRIPERTLQPLGAGAYYHHQLVGCVVTTRDGVTVGPVTRVDGGTGGSLLVVLGSAGDVLIPLADEICVAIDVARRTIEIVPPPGLLELNEPVRRERSAGGHRPSSTE